MIWCAKPKHQAAPACDMLRVIRPATGGALNLPRSESGSNWAPATLHGPALVLPCATVRLRRYRVWRSVSTVVAGASTWNGRISVASSVVALGFADQLDERERYAPCGTSRPCGILRGRRRRRTPARTESTECSGEHPTRKGKRMASREGRGRLGGISTGGIIVIVGIIIMVVWSFVLGLIVTLIGLIAFGGFVRGKWY